MFALLETYILVAQIIRKNILNDYSLTQSDRRFWLFDRITKTCYNNILMIKSVLFDFIFYDLFGLQQNNGYTPETEPERALFVNIGSSTTLNDFQ